jgi:hypothetical protein
MPFQRAHDPDSPGQILLRDGDPVASIVWCHDFAERARTGWFLVLLDGSGEPADEEPRRLAVSSDVDRLVADAELDRGAWLAQAETLELVTATAAVDAGERALARLIGD